MLTIIFNVTLGLMGLACLACWAMAFQKRSRGEPLFLQRDIEPNPLGLLDVLIMFGLWFVGQTVSVFVAIFLLDIPIEDLESASASQMAQFMIAVGVIQLAGTILAMLIIRARYGSFQFLGWKPNVVGTDFRLAIIGFLLVVPVTLLVQSLVTSFWDYEHPTLQMLMDVKSLLALASAWLMAFIVAPITEEIFFRGILQNWLQRLYEKRAPLEKLILGSYYSAPVIDSNVEATAAVPLDQAFDTENPFQAPAESLNASSTIASANIASANDSGMPTGVTYWLPIVVSSAFFALAHVGQGPAPIPLFFFSIGLGWVFRQTGSIFPCIIMHMMLNGFSLFWFTLPILFPELGGIDPDPVSAPN
jgi:membrane protease YdiL (CAAX protease family)